MEAHAHPITVQLPVPVTMATPELIAKHVHFLFYQRQNKHF